MDGRLHVGSTPRTTGKVFKAFDPSTLQEIGPEIAIAGDGDVDEACRIADRAFDGFRETPAALRSSLLDTIAANVEGMRDAILERVVIETRLPADRLALEFVRTLNQTRMFARLLREGTSEGVVIEHSLPDRLPFRRPDLRQRRIALGPVAMFGSSNFPLAFSVAGGDTVSALAAGCPVIVKGHPAHPGTSALVGVAVRRAVESCGLDEGVFTLLQSPNTSLGAALVRDPRIKAVAFTGSRGGGLALSDIAAQRPEPIPVFAEMSSVNPVVLFPAALSARADEIARGYVASMTVGAGQLCTNPGIVIAFEHQGFDTFLDTAAREIAASAAQIMLSSGIHAAYEAGVASLAEHTDVVTLALGEDDADANRGRAALFVTSATEFVRHPELAGEIFGAASLVIRATGVEQVRAVIEALEGQLTITMHIEDADLDLARSLLPLMERKAGRIIANGWPTGVEVSRAMVHGGPYPATSDASRTSVGTTAIERFLRPVCYQDLPDVLLPEAVRDSNPRSLLQAVHED